MVGKDRHVLVKGTKVVGMYWAFSSVNDMIKVPYAQAIGNLMYAMTSTTPDICHTIELVSRY